MKHTVDGSESDIAARALLARQGYRAALRTASRNVVTTARLGRPEDAAWWRAIRDWIHEEPRR